MWSHFVDAYRKENYCRFRGVASRREFWSFVLFYYLILLALGLVLGLIAQEIGGLVVAVIFVLFMLFSLLPSLAITVRRLHDTKRSGWWILGIGLIQSVCEVFSPEGEFILFDLSSLAAFLWLLVMLCQASRPSRYSIEIVSPAEQSATTEKSALTSYKVGHTRSAQCQLWRYSQECDEAKTHEDGWGDAR